MKQELCEHGYSPLEEAKCHDCLACSACGHTDYEHVHPELAERDPFESRTPCNCRECFII